MRRVIAITGDGKGKTTSAIGCAIRALGRGNKVGFYQFLKSKDAQYGEHLFFKNNKKLKIIPLGLGCRKDFNYSDKDIEAALDGFNRIVKDHKKSKFNLIVLDEISYPINWGWIKVEQIVDFVKSNPKTSFVLTGRDLPQNITDLADTVSEVKEIKHAYQAGVTAQKGIEF